MHSEDCQTCTFKGSMFLILRRCVLEWEFQGMMTVVVKSVRARGRNHLGW